MTESMKVLKGETIVFIIWLVMGLISQNPGFIIWIIVFSFVILILGRKGYSALIYTAVIAIVINMLLY